MAPYAEELLAARERKKRPLTSAQAARPERRYLMPITGLGQIFVGGAGCCGRSVAALQRV
jgi:hypothetical protein